MNTISFYLESIKNQLTENGLIPAIFTLSAAAFTLSVVSVCARSDGEKTHPSFFPFFFDILTAVGVYFLCVTTPADGGLEKYRSRDVVSFSLITAFVCFFVLISLYAVALLILTPKRKKKEKKDEEALTCCTSLKRRCGKISEINLPVYSVSTSKLGTTKKSERINFSAVKEILDRTYSKCPPAFRGEIDGFRESIFPYETIDRAFVAEFDDILPKILKLWARYCD